MDLRFRQEWQEGRCLISSYLNDIYQLSYDKDRGVYYIETFYSVTGGNWIFVLDKDGSKAYRRNIRIGRQNPQYYEVLEGLEPGEQVIEALSTFPIFEGLRRWASPSSIAFTEGILVSFFSSA